MTDTATAQELFDSARAALWAMQARGQDPDWGVECFDFCEPYELTISALVEIEWNGSAALCLVTICDEDDISLECEGARADIHFARLGGVIKSAPSWYDAVRDEERFRMEAEIEQREQMRYEQSHMPGRI